jgi:hypothetical protein
MSLNKIIYALTGIVAGLIAVIFVFTLIELFTSYRSNTYFNPNQVRGMAVFHNAIPYTLNFDQQNEVLNYLNEAIVVQEKGNVEKAPFDKIVIYRFEQPELALEPIGVLQDNIIFSASSWNGNGYRMTNSSLSDLITQTYDD